jgi:hypothetical protein
MYTICANYVIILLEGDKMDFYSKYSTLKVENIHIKTTGKIKEEMKLEGDSLGLTLSAYIVFLHKERMLNKLERRNKINE